MKTKLKLGLIILSLLLINISCKKAKSLNTFTDPRDNQVYEIITIDSQTWFAENLRYASSQGSIENPNNHDPKYGRLYTWQAAYLGCPPGWRLPSDRDWNILETSLGMNQSADWDLYGYRANHGKRMKSTTGWLANGNGDNSSGFNVVPAGYHSFPDPPQNETGFYALGEEARFWTSTDPNPGTGRLVRVLEYSADGVYRDFYVDIVNNYYSCRCIKN